MLHRGNTLRAAHAHIGAGGSQRADDLLVDPAMQAPTLPRKPPAAAQRHCPGKARLSVRVAVTLDLAASVASPSAQADAVV